MGASSRPFLALQEEIAWFIECPEIRVMHVETGGEERPTVITQVALAEGPPNRARFFVAEDGHTSDDPGWVPRAARMREVHERQRVALAEQGYHLAELPPPTPAADDVATMAYQIRDCLWAQDAVPEISGIVLVLAPTVLEEPEAFAHAVLTLLAHLPAVRIVIIELGNACVEYLARGAGTAGLFATCIIDKDARRKETAAALAASARALPGASPQAKAGFATPRNVVAPPRHGKPARDAPLSPELQQVLTEAMGPKAALAGPAGSHIDQLIRRAAAAIGEKRYAEGVELQREACAECLRFGIVDIACVLEISLAAYMLVAGDQRSAIIAYESAAGRARMVGHARNEALALIGLAHVRNLGGDVVGAVRDHTAAGEAAERAGDVPLAVEAYRSAGHLALASAPGVAANAWWRALRLLAPEVPSTAASTSAADVARRLALLYQQHSPATAQALLADAEAYERGLPTRQRSSALLIGAETMAEDGVADARG